MALDYRLAGGDWSCGTRPALRPRLDCLRPTTLPARRDLLVRNRMVGRSLRAGIAQSHTVIEGLSPALVFVGEFRRLAHDFNSFLLNRSRLSPSQFGTMKAGRRCFPRDQALPGHASSGSSASHDELRSGVPARRDVFPSGAGEQGRIDLTFTTVRHKRIA
jgi:hypothetical protein